MLLDFTLGDVIDCVSGRNSGKHTTSSRNTAKKVSSDYKWEIYKDRLLGEGSWSKVYVGRCKKTHLEAACKIVQKETIEKHKNVPVVTNELVLKHLDHPNIVKLYDFEELSDRTILYIEYVKGVSLHTYVEDRTRLSDNIARRILSQVVGAIQYCHFRGLVHRDMKLENILVYDSAERLIDLKIKICDFGLSAYVPQDGKKLDKWCGSLSYASPELLCHKPYTFEVDVWAVGICFYSMIEGVYPFHGSTHNELIDSVIEADPKYLYSTIEAQQLLKKFLKKNNRPTIDEISKDIYLL